MARNQYSSNFDPEHNFFVSLNQSATWWHLDGDFKYCVKISPIGSLSLKIKATDTDKELGRGGKPKTFFRVSTNEPILDILFIDFIEKNELNLYNEKSVRKYLINSGYNIAKQDIRYVNIIDIINKIVFHPDVNIYNTCCKVETFVSRPDINFNIISPPPNNYKYCNAINLPKKLGSIDQVKPLVNELFDDIRVFFTSCEKIDELERFMFHHNFYSYITKIDKYDLKAFSTFYNSFNKDSIEYHLNHIDHNSLNRILTLANKIETSIGKGQINNINLTIKGIKIHFNGNARKIIFKIPTLKFYTLDSDEVKFLYAYLTSLDEFDSLTYKFERIYLSSL